MSPLAQSSSSGPTPSLILGELLANRKARNPSYSLRCLARDLGMSHSYLSLLLRGKRRLAVPLALRLSARARLSAPEAQRLIDSSRDAAALPLSPRRPSPKAEPFVTLELDRFRLLADWYHVAILDLTQLRNFRSSPRWVARRLGISEKEVRLAVRRLRRLGLMELRNGRWTKAHARLAVPTYGADEAILRFHEAMVQKGLEFARSRRPEDFERREISGTVLTADPKRVARAKERIRKFRRQLLDYLSGGERTELFQLNVQFFPLTHPSPKRRRTR